MSIEIFVSYARRDQALWKSLKTALALPGTKKDVQLWSAHENILSGQASQREIDAHLRKAQIFLLLLSPDFFVDNQCLDQMQQAFLRQEQVKEPVYVVPILLRPCIWERDGLEELQILPRKEIPVTSWPQRQRDQIMLDIAQEIYAIVALFNKKRFF